MAHGEEDEISNCHNAASSRIAVKSKTLCYIVLYFMASHGVTKNSTPLPDRQYNATRTASHCALHHPVIETQ